MTISHGYCHCGCGTRTGLAVQNDIKAGYVKGQPYRFANGHNRYHSVPEYVVDLETGCWNWQRSKVAGYGRKATPQGNVMAHRFYYESVHGAIPEGLELDHLCRNRACVNPEHVEAVERIVNIQRCPATKLKPHQVIEIRYLYAAGISPVDLATDFAIHPSQVYRIIRGGSWTNV